MKVEKIANGVFYSEGKLISESEGACLGLNKETASKGTIAYSILKNHITEYGIEVDNELFKKLDTYASLLKEWNEKINLTAILDDEGIAVKHFLDCLLVGKYAEFKKGDKIILCFYADELAEM